MLDKTRVTIVAGFLGAGKTTVLQGIVRNTSNAAHIAVLVNEFGAVGVDGDQLKTAEDQVDIHELVGGCICCSSSVAFRHTLVEILRNHPERIYIEPTGLAAIGAIKDILNEPGIAPAVHLDPSLVVVDPRHWQQDHVRSHELYIEHQAEADIMIVTHTDCCDAELLQQFTDAHAHITMIIARHGVLEKPWNEFISEEVTAQKVTNKSPAPTVEGFRSDMVWWPATQKIDLTNLEKILQDNPPPPTVMRCKGIIHSNDGWHSVHFADGTLAHSSTADGNYSRLVLISEEDPSVHAWWEKIQPQLTSLNTE